MEIRVRKPCPTALGEKVNVQRIPDLLAEPVVVGTVVKTGDDDQDPLLWEIRVQPSCDLDRLDVVSVIVLRSS
jgi:hypothetical protein